MAASSPRAFRMASRVLVGVGLMAFSVACGSAGGTKSPTGTASSSHSSSSTASAPAASSPAASRGAAAGSPLPVIIQTFPSCDCAWLNYVASAEHFWEKNGLDAKLVTVATGPQAMAGVAAGSVNLAIVDYPLAGSFIQQGHALMSVSGGLLSHWSLVAKKGADLPHLSSGLPASVQDLKGKKVAVNALGSSTYYFLQALIQSAGMSMKDITVVPTGGTPQELAAIQSGRVDAAIEEATSTFVLTHDNGAKIIYDFRDASQDLSKYPLLKEVTGVPWIGYYGSADWAKGHAETVKRVQLALMDADVWMHDPANFDALLKLLTPKLPKVPSGQEADLVKFVLPSLATYFPMSAADGWSDVGFKLGITKSPIPATQWVYPSLPATPDEVQSRVKAAGGA